MNEIDPQLAPQSLKPPVRGAGLALAGVYLLPSLVIMLGLLSVAAAIWFHRPQARYATAGNPNAVLDTWTGEVWTLTGTANTKYVWKRVASPIADERESESRFDR